MSPPWSIFWVTLAVVGAAAIALSLRGAILRSLRRWAPASSPWHAFGESIRVPSVLWCVALALYASNEAAFEASLLPARWHERLGLLLELAVILSLTITLAGLSGAAVARASERRLLGGPVTGLAHTTTRVTVLIVGGLVVLSALGVQITPILTALGVGGLAVALALQDTLANLFAGVHLLADKPIRVGDYVKVSDNAEGFVVDIGWRSTRIRSLSNNIVVAPNQTVARATITNYSLPEPRMGLGLKVSVDYSADPDRVEALLLDEVTRALGQVPGLLREPAPTVSLIPGFGEYSLDFTVGYHVATFVAQYGVQHELRRRLIKRLGAEGVSIPVLARAVQPFRRGVRAVASTGHAGS